ncbi:MAG: cytochrome c oxidase subunit 3 [Rickettsiaceae bacterium]|jgi:cytochrome c oxidase subunit 3|nr:cytochrome c oxidase subunit 3 [Rickettsiaceae bacterium]
MASNQEHPFHLVALSHWPIATAFSLLALTLGMVMFMHDYAIGKFVLGFGTISVAYCSWNWWSDVIKEGRSGKHHTEPVRTGLRIGMSLFILSEIMFFFAFFFSFFSASLFPAGILEGSWVVAEGTWPPEGIKTFDPWDIPFINTLILLLSGTTVTWAHHAVLHNDQKNSVNALGITVLLGISFTILQAYEYHHAAFKLTDGVYAANFYLATGFHGLHVMLGTVFLAVCYFRAKKGHFVRGQGHLGFEFAAWYWHFVDVVWLFLFTFVYVLGR